MSQILSNIVPNEELYQEWREWFLTKFGVYPELVVIGINKTQLECRISIRKSLDTFNHDYYVQNETYEWDKKFDAITTFEEWLKWINSRCVLYEKFIPNPHFKYREYTTKEVNCYS
jgi:hypothetical protein